MDGRGDVDGVGAVAVNADRPDGHRNGPACRRDGVARGGRERYLGHAVRVPGRGPGLDDVEPVVVEAEVDRVLGDDGVTGGFDRVEGRGRGQHQREVQTRAVDRRGDGGGQVRIPADRSHEGAVRFEVAQPYAFGRRDRGQGPDLVDDIVGRLLDGDGHGPAAEPEFVGVSGVRAHGDPRVLAARTAACIVVGSPA